MAALREAKPTRQRIYRAVLLVSIALVLVGGFGCFLGVASPLVVSETTELPLGKVSSIAVDGQGQLFVAIPFYQRVQLYGADGEFIKAIAIDSGGGTFNVGLSDVGRVHVATSRTALLLEYESDGRLLSRAETPNAMSDYPAGTVAVLGSRTYEVKSDAFWQYISRSGSAAGEVFVETPLHLKPISGPMPARGILAAGVLALSCRQWLLRRERSP